MQLFLLEICQGMLDPGTEGWEAATRFGNTGASKRRNLTLHSISISWHIPKQGGPVWLCGNRSLFPCLGDWDEREPCLPIFPNFRYFGTAG